jgi:hypothetical protein
MVPLERATDVLRVRIRPVVGLLVGTLAVVAFIGTSASAGAGGAACGVDLAGNGGYTYAGHQATRKGHGVRATISAVRAPEVAAGHVAAWVGLGGPGQGPNGTDMWVQVGLASMPGMGTVLYAEVTRPSRAPAFRLLEENIQVGDSRRVAVLEMSRRPEWWRIWVNGVAVSEPIHLADSSERWAPIATAESWNGGQVACNQFAFRFERVSVSHGRGGSWFAFRPGYDFRDGNYRLRSLASAASPDNTVARRLTHEGGPLPYAFVAASS